MVAETGFERGDAGGETIMEWAGEATQDLEWRACCLYKLILCKGLGHLYLHLLPHSDHHTDPQSHHHSPP